MYSNDKNEIIVLSAASMADVMNEIVVEFEKIQDTNVHISFAGSQYLAQQLIIGSAGDIILSAGERPIEFLLEREIVEPIRPPITISSPISVRATASR